MLSRPRPRALVVGAGLMGRWHAYEVARVGSHVAGVVDPDPDRAQELSRRHRVPAFPDLNRALEDGRSFDVVHVCTPTSSHAELVRTALAAGCHVLVEKPLAPDAPTTSELLDVAAASGLHLAPVHQFIFQRGVRELLRLVESDLGPLRHVAITACSAGAAGRGAARTADDVAAEILPHVLSLANAFLPGGLHGVAWTAHRPASGELRLLGLAGAVSVATFVSMAARPPRTLLEVAGERGSGYADLFHGFAVSESGGTGRAWKAARPLVVPGRTLLRAMLNLSRRAAARQPAYPGLRELIGAFHRAVVDEAPNPVPTAEALSVARARDRILEEVALPNGR